MILPSNSVPNINRVNRGRSWLSTFKFQIEFEYVEFNFYPLGCNRLINLGMTFPLRFLPLCVDSASNISEVIN